MCNCTELKEIVVDLNSSWISQAVPYQGKEIFSEFFEEIEAEEFEPELNYSKFYYSCNDCGQDWYFECAPIESTFPLFGIKLENIEQRLSKDEIDAQKELASILAHNGFKASRCRNSECNNFKLKGKEFCQRHLSIL